MNREIKFRGITFFGNRWVYGYYEVFEAEAYIIDEGERYSVIAETVGQYTGLKDCDGVEIYEGDIVCYNDYTSVYKPKLTGEIMYYQLQLCIFDKKQMYNKYHSLPYNEDMAFTIKKIKKIGNIHDNPELLERIEKGIE